MNMGPCCGAYCIMVCHNPELGKLSFANLQRFILDTGVHALSACLLNLHSALHSIPCSPWCLTCLLHPDLPGPCQRVPSCICDNLKLDAVGELWEVPQVV